MTHLNPTERSIHSVVFLSQSSFFVLQKTSSGIVRWRFIGWLITDCRRFDRLLLYSHILVHTCNSTIPQCYYIFLFPQYISLDVVPLCTRWHLQFHQFHLCSSFPLTIAFVRHCIVLESLRTFAHERTLNSCRCIYKTDKISSITSVLAQVELSGHGQSLGHVAHSTTSMWMD